MNIEQKKENKSSWPHIDFLVFFFYLYLKLHKCTPDLVFGFIFLNGLFFICADRKSLQK